MTSVVIFLVCYHSILQTKLGKMSPRKSEDILVALRKKVKEANQTEKNNAQIGLLLGIPRTTINRLKVMVV